MKLLKGFSFSVLVIIMILGSGYGYLKITGADQKLLVAGMAFVLKPNNPFSKSDMGDAPLYSRDDNWLTLPARIDEADLVPKGQESSNNDGSASVDVFYIHGTGYVNNNRWTSPMLSNTATADNAKFSLANEASIFNGCCNIYAPHFREASIFAYMALAEGERDKLLDAVYEDIASAFKYYWAHYNNNRPFVIASHSQGTHLAMRLLREIDAAPSIADRLVVGYLVGSGPVSLTESYVESLQHFHVCSNATDTQCIVHWNTYGENGTEKIFSSPEPSLCVNPLSWRNDNELAERALNSGSVSISGAYTMRMVGEDYSDEVIFEPPSSPTVGYTWAQCKESFLYVADQEGTDYEKLGKLPDKSYHGIDFPLFHMNIRENVLVRIESYRNFRDH